jgi:type II secretory pathway component PulK
VLVLAVVAVTLLSLLVGALGSWVSFTLDVAQRFEKQARVYHVISGGARFASVLVRIDPTPTYDALQENWLQMADWKLMVIQGVRADAGPGLIDESRKLNLNTATADLLKKFFIAAEVDEDAARVLADSIIDWRDEDDKELSYGAEGFHYRAREDGYECKDGPFESVEELLLVRGMTPEIWLKVSPNLTVYGGGINLNTADRPVLNALGLSSQGVEGIITHRVGEDDIAGTPDDRHFESVDQMAVEMETLLPLEDKNLLGQLYADKAVAFRAEAFGLKITGDEGTTKSRMSVWCVIDRKGRVLSWREA